MGNILKAHCFLFAGQSRTFTSYSYSKIVSRESERQTVTSQVQTSQSMHGNIYQTHLFQERGEVISKSWLSCSCVFFPTSS